MRWVVGSHGAEWPGEEREHRAWRTRVGGWRSTLYARLAGRRDRTRGEAAAPWPCTIGTPAIRARPSYASTRRIDDLLGANAILGKKVVNLLPAIGAGDKGTACERLVGLASAERIRFIGDDVTDEAAFGTSLNIPAVMVRVGRTPIVPGRRMAPGGAPTSTSCCTGSASCANRPALQSRTGVDRPRYPAPTPASSDPRWPSCRSSGASNRASTGAPRRC